MLQDILVGYSQLIKKITHIGDALFDHVYVLNIFLEEFGVYVSILDLYFFDQDAVMVKPSKNEIVFHIIYIQFNKIVSTFL